MLGFYITVMNEFQRVCRYKYVFFIGIYVGGRLCLRCIIWS